MNGSKGYGRAVFEEPHISEEGDQFDIGAMESGAGTDTDTSHRNRADSSVRGRVAGEDGWRDKARKVETRVAGRVRKGNREIFEEFCHILRGPWRSSAGQNKSARPWRPSAMNLLISTGSRFSCKTHKITTQ